MIPFGDVETPALLLHMPTLAQNLRRMKLHLAKLGGVLRPHAKTAKCHEVVRLAIDGGRNAIAVSTLKEADYFLGHGIRDILYAVGIAPGKLDHVASLIRRGAKLTVTLDNVVSAREVARCAMREDVTIPVLIELDVDGHRSGVGPDSPVLVELARELAAAPGVELQGVLTHAGESYNCRSRAALVDMAERERAGAAGAARTLRDMGLPIPVVSVGSTPTATFARSLCGITEVRAGVYMFQDLVMSGLGVCRTEDIALSVLVSVIGHRRDRNWIITDGGWMALSRDRGTATQAIDQGYGLVCDVDGHPVAEDLIVQACNQEHGIVARRDQGPLDEARFPVGSKLRVLPNHACATAAQHEKYFVVGDERGRIVQCWSRVNGW